MMTDYGLVITVGKLSDHAEKVIVVTDRCLQSGSCANTNAV